MEVEQKGLQHPSKKSIKINERQSYNKNLDTLKKTSSKIPIKWHKLMMMMPSKLLKENLEEEKTKKE